MTRPFQKADVPALLTLLKLNIPQYFDPSEAADYKAYLKNEVEDYFVLEAAGKIVGAGGVNYFRGDCEARLSWDIMHPDYQGRGFGRALVNYRVRHIRSQFDIQCICVRTSQLAYKFYEKVGFELEKVEENYWAEGFHLYQMRMKL